MRKNRIFAFTVAMLLGVGTIGSITSFADTLATTQNGQERPQKPENEVIGKIAAISANSVTIALAERKMPENNGQLNGQDNRHGFGNGQRPESFDNNGQGFNGEKPPEPPKDANGETLAPPNGTNQIAPPNDGNANINFNFDDMFTLTGESTTIDISSATFDDFRERKNNNNSSNSTNTTKTYSDYSVGDYVMIELTSSTSKVAKSVRSANMMHGGMGPRGSKPNMNNNQTTQ